MTVGQRVKLLRMHLGLEQSEFAQKLKLSQSTLSKIENDSQKISQEAITALIMDFNVDSKWLLAGVGGDKPVFDSPIKDDYVPKQYLTEAERKVMLLQEQVIQLQNDKILRQEQKIDEQKHN